MRCGFTKLALFSCLICFSCTAATLSLLFRPRTSKPAERLLRESESATDYGGSTRVNTSCPPGCTARVPHELPRAQHEAPLVSIITPVSRSNLVYANETIMAVARQTFQVMHWIIVADGLNKSEHEGLRSILETYWHGKFQVLSCGGKKICGPGRCRNMGFAACTTPFALTLDSDDLIESTYVEKLVWQLVSAPEFAYANSFSVGFGAKEYLWPKTLFESSFQENKQSYSALFRISSLKSSSRWPDMYDSQMSLGGVGGGEDWELWLWLKEQNLHGVTVPEFLFWYREKRVREKWYFLDGSGDRFPLSLRKLKYPHIAVQGYDNPRLSESLGNHSLVSFRNVHEKTGGNLLMIIPWMAMGGADTFNVRIVELVSKMGWKVTIVCTLATSGQSAVSSRLEFMRPALQLFTDDIFVLPHFIQIHSYLSFLLYLIQSRRCDVVLLSNSYAGYTLLPFLRANSPGVAFVDLVHMREPDFQTGLYFASQRKGGGYAYLSLLCSRFLHVSLVGSSEEQRVAASLGHWQDLLHFGVDTSFFSPSRSLRLQEREKMVLSEMDIVLLFVGRVVAQKRPLDVLGIFHQAVQQYNGPYKIALVVAGTGVLLESMKIDANKKELKVFFVGEVGKNEMRSIFAASDILVMPSLVEGLSIALLEAMSMGVVPLATDVGGQKEAVQHGGGFLFGTDYKSAMVERILGLSQERGLMRECSRKARETVLQNFSTESMRTVLSKTLRKAVSSAQAPFYWPEEDKALRDLPSALQAIADNDSHSSRTNMLNQLHYGGRRTKISRFCKEDGAIMSSWIAKMENAYFCDPTESKGSLYELLIRNCGKLCLADATLEEVWAFETKEGCFLRVARMDQCESF